MTSNTPNSLGILLVEDNPGDAYLLRQTLADVPGRDYAIKHVDRLADGLRAAQLSTVDVAILDLSLPDSYGVETVTRFRRECPNIPIVVMTGQNDIHVGADAIREGAQDCLTKGLMEPLFLARVIDDAIERLAFTHKLNATTQALTAGEERLRLIIDANVDAMLLLDRDGVVQFANRASEELFGRSLQELAARPIGFPAVAGESTHIDILRPDGSTVVAEMRAAAIDIGGDHTILASLRDITDRIALEERLRQAERLEVVGRLTGGIAHEFNNLLTVINGYCELLIDDIDPSQPGHEEIVLIHQAGLHAAELTQRMLAFGQRQMLQPVVLDPNEVVHSVVRALADVIPVTVMLSLDLGDDVESICVDRDQMDKALVNLAMNAFDAMPSGGTLTIKTWVLVLEHAEPFFQGMAMPGRYVMISVADTGEGMSAEATAHLFEPFFTTKNMAKGTGLGLPMVLGLVRQSHGYVRVLSKPGEGCRVDMLFPIAKEDVFS